MEKSVIEALQKRFPESEVRKRKGNFGKPITYIETAHILDRLNDCFAAEWSFRLLSKEELSTGEILVHGRLEALGIVKEAFGRGYPVTSKDSGEIFSKVDAYKQAASDCIKRCSRLFIGMSAFPASDESTQESQRFVPRSHSHVGTRSPATTKQLQAIKSISRSLRLSEEAVANRCKVQFNTTPENLTKRDASQFISLLSDELRGAA